VRPIAMKDLLAHARDAAAAEQRRGREGGGPLQGPAVTAVRGSISPALGGVFAQPIAPGFSVSWCRCSYVGAKDMERLLQPFASDNTVRIDERATW
jgi:hypothetical protein